MICCRAQGAIKADSKVIISSSGQRKDHTGLRRLIKLFPLESQITISESFHHRVSTISTDTNTVSMSRGFIKLRALKTISGTTSSPSTRPEAARPSARIRIIVTSVVNSTEKTPPAVDRSSLTKDWWKSIFFIMTGLRNTAILS